VRRSVNFAKVRILRILDASITRVNISVTRILAAVAIFFPPALHPLLGPNRCVRIIGANRGNHPSRSSPAFFLLANASSFVHRLCTVPLAFRLRSHFNLPRREYVDIGKYSPAARMTNAESSWKGSSKGNRREGPSGNRPRLMRLLFSSVISSFPFCDMYGFLFPVCIRSCL